MSFTQNADANMESLTSLIKQVVDPSKASQISINPHHATLLYGTKLTGKSSKAPKKKQKSKNAPLTRRESSQLGFYCLPTKAFKYDELRPLNQLWEGYIRNHLVCKDGIVPSVDDPAYTNFSKSLVKADFHGARATVLRSKCPSLVGISGIVVMDTKNTFKLVGRDDKLRTVPKTECVLTIHVDNLEFTIFGRHLAIRPAERSVKKIKNCMLLDL